MKKNLGFWTVNFVLSILSACQQVPEDGFESRGYVKLNVSATTISKTNIGEWGNGVEEDWDLNGIPVHTRASDEAVSRMAFVLLNEDDEKVLSQDKKSTEDGYMNLVAEVPVGSYKLIAYGHNGNNAATIGTDLTITADNEKQTDAFLHYQTLELDEESEDVLDITLNRCVAKLSFKHTDVIPEGAASVEIKYTGASNELDASTGLATEAVEQTVIIQIPESPANKVGNTFSTYCFLSAKESTVDATLTTKDGEGNVITSYVVNDIPVEINTQTICSGMLFHASQNIGVTINSEWNTPKEISF